MGEARCFVAERDGRVLGVVAVAVRGLTLPDGRVIRSGYIGDVKIDPCVRGSKAFLALARAAGDWLRPRVAAAFGVVMDGTTVLPANYTGRLGIEEFKPVAAVAVCRIPTDANGADVCTIVDANKGASVFRELSAGRVFCDDGVAGERSETEPVWFVNPDRSACGRLEDTRRAKRLIGDDDIELHSAHLACFAWKTPAAAADVIRSAGRTAARLGFPALFLAISGTDSGSIRSIEPLCWATVAGAAVYAARFHETANWNINTSEI
jgi:hypothetical protein